ncbi:RagB/SusD family nutrient uptake outer membrane protein [Sphingobacterium sp. SRCM116780]|uniref:RagB/SusD family nutrient uptake outer membrane protein n=1 Tax=Sphingobacterium sp. SRCM116780 TaxID=2907623 RepID=UPI001F168267|nr:RagB/SusD family nutrient uptake outer membrane protein [Sphingobacterium sp. SRCM116780]UIR55681.1 RagB/SusD family nutrient uptake outer membrane protein [Sphingobacterium sp. SRCM116780]
MRSLNIYKLSGLLLLSTLSIVQSCNIDDIKPSNAITEENVIRDETTAQYVLNSVYVRWRAWYTGSSAVYQGYLSNEIIPTAILDEAEGMDVNNVTPDNQFVQGYYTELYGLINQANWLIASLEADKAPGMSAVRKNEMIAEAKCQRAMAHFNLLRCFGQFYDLNSQYGVVIRLEPSRGLQIDARKTVQESYDAIINDLQFAAINGPKGVVHTQVSSTTASAFLAKVYLYAGNFSAAQSEALKVMNNTDSYGLEGNFKDIFLKRFESKETLFSPFANGDTEKHPSMSRIQLTLYSNDLEQLANNQVAGGGSLSGNGSGYDPRFSYAYAVNSKGPQFNGKYPYFDRDFSNTFPISGLTTYQLRMAEIYLIHAEAKARLATGNTADTEAIADVNAIRLRAGGLSPIAPANKAALLVAIRQEKLLELFGENGEPWFDIVRFDRLGDLNAATVKSTISNANKFIMPLAKTVLLGNNKLIQNPGYPSY